MMPDRKYNWLHSVIEQRIFFIAICDIEDVFLAAFSIGNRKEKPLCVSFGVYIIL